MANQIVDFYRQQNPGYTGTDDSITLLYAEEYANELPHLLKNYPDFATDYNKIYDHAFPITAGDRAKQVAGSLIRGVAGTVAAIPEAVGIARVEAFGRGLGVGTTDYRETLMSQLAEGIRGVGEWASPEVAEAKAENMADDFFTTIVPGAFGSGIGFLTTGGLTGIGVRGAAGGLLKAGGAKATAAAVKSKAKAIPSVRSWDTARKKVVVQKAGKEAGERYAKKKAAQINTGSIAALGSAANATAGYKDALANGGTPEQALSSYLLNGVVGLSEATPLARMLNRLDNASGGTFMYYLSNAAPEVFEEALQETFQGVAGDIIAANIVKYDPDRVMFEHLEQDAGAGGISGGLLSLITSALSRKARLLGDEKAGKFVEGEGFVPGFEGGETVVDAKKRYTGGREGDIAKLAMLVSLQRQDDPTGEDQEAWEKLKQAHEAVIGDDADAQMIFEAALFEVGSTLAADRAEGVITTELGKVASPERGRYRAGEKDPSAVPQREVRDTQLLTAADIIGAEEELDPDLEENFADFKGQLLEQRNALVVELMDANNSINLARAGIEDSAVTPDQRAAYEQMLVGKREELSGRIQAINVEIEGVDQRLSEVGRATPKVDLVDTPQTFDPEARKIEAEQALEIETRLVARLREELAELEELEKEEAFTAEQQEYWDSLHQDLADDREALEQIRDEMEAELLDRLAALETTNTSEFSEEDLQGHAELVEITRGQLEGGVTAGQAAAAAGLTSDQLSRLVRYTEGNTEWSQHRPAPATLVPRRAEGARTVGPIGESLERRKARLEGIIEGKSRKGWSFSAERFVSKPIPKKEKEDARIELEKINADLARIEEAETVVRGPDQLTAGELNASIKGQEQYIRLLERRVAAGETVFKGTGLSILAEIESRRKLVSDLKAKHATKRKAQAAAAEFDTEKNAKKSHSIGIEQALDTAGEKSEKADKRFNRLVGQLKVATPAERDALNKERASIPVVTALDKQIQSNIKKIDNLEGRAAKAKRQKTKDKFQQQANKIKAENTKLSLEKRQILGLEAGLTMEEAADPAVEVKETKKTAHETIVDDWINTKNEVTQQQRNLRDAGKREVLDVRNVEIITHFAARDPGKGQTPTSVEFGSNKQDRELKAGPAYYEIGTDDATQATGWGREATETLRKYQEATTEEERTELAQKLASQLARGANVRQTSGVSRRLISFVAPDKKIWVLGISRSGKDKTKFSLVPPGTDPNDKVGYEGVLFEDLLAQGFIPFAAIRLRNPAYRLNYKIESAEEYQRIVAPIKLEVVDTPAFLEQVSQGPVSKTVSLDAIIENVEPVFEGAGVITETEDALEAADQLITPSAAIEEGGIIEEPVEDLTVTVLTPEGAGKVYDILTTAGESLDEAPTDEEIDIAIEEAVEDIIESDEELGNLINAIGVGLPEGIELVDAIQNHLVKQLKENGETKESFIQGVLNSEFLQSLAKKALRLEIKTRAEAEAKAEAAEKVKEEKQAASLRDRATYVDAKGVEHYDPETEEYFRLLDAIKTGAKISSFPKHENTGKVYVSRQIEATNEEGEEEYQDREEELNEDLWHEGGLEGIEKEREALIEERKKLAHKGVFLGPMSEANIDLFVKWREITGAGEKAAKQYEKENQANYDRYRQIENRLSELHRTWEYMVPVNHILSKDDLKRLRLNYERTDEWESKAIHFTEAENLESIAEKGLIKSAESGGNIFFMAPHSLRRWFSDIRGSLRWVVASGGDRARLDLDLTMDEGTEIDREVSDLIMEGFKKKYLIIGFSNPSEADQTQDMQMAPLMGSGTASLARSTRTNIPASELSVWTEEGWVPLSSLTATTKQAAVEASEVGNVTDELVKQRVEDESDPNYREDTVSERVVPQRAVEGGTTGEFAVFPDGLDTTGARPIEGTHKTSNMESLEEDFQAREFKGVPVGISIARIPQEELSSPTSAEPKGTKGVVTVIVTGKGLDYAKKADRKIIDDLLRKSRRASEKAMKEGAEPGSPETMVSAIPGLLEMGIDWVNGWNSIGESRELHVINPSVIQIKERETAPKPFVASEINSSGETVRMTSEEYQDPAFRKANKLAKLEYFVDEKTGKKMLVNQPSSGPDIARGRNAPDRPDSAYPRVPQRKLNKIFTYLIERLRALGVQVEVTEREFANAATKAKAMFGFANGKPVIVLAMNSLENPTTQNLFDLLHEIGHAVTADMPQGARLRVLAAIAKLNDSVLKIPGRKYRIPLDEAGEIDSEIEQEERLVEAIAQALVSENFDPTTANTLASKIVRFFRNLMLAVKQAFHRMMGHEGEVAMNYFKVQVEAMLTGKEAPAYLSWVSGYKYSVSERMDSMELEDSDSVIDSIYDLASFSKEYKLVVGDSPEAVEHNIKWAGIRFTVERDDLSEEDLAGARMRAQRIIASENALNEILTGLYDTFRRTAGSRYVGLDKETFINYLTNGSLPDERIKTAVAASKDESLVNTQMQDLEGEEAKQSAAVMLHRHLSRIETRLKKLNDEANIELSESVPGSSVNKNKKAHEDLIKLTTRYEDLEVMQDHIYKISEELIKGMAEKTDKTIPRVLKELGLKATAKEIEAARNKRLNSDFIDALEFLSTEITEWGRGAAESIQEKIALLGNPVTDILDDPATLALAISIGRNQKAAMALLALRREGDFEGMKQAFNKAVSAAMSGDPKTALAGWNTKVSRSSRKDAAFERITTKLRKVLAKLVEAQTKSDATREDLENYERQNTLYEKLSEPLAQYQEEVGAIFGKESILPDWFENINRDGKEWAAVDGALYVVPPDPSATLNDLKNPANHRSLDLMNIKNIGEMVRHIEKMNAWLQAQPIDRRGGEYNMIKRMVDRMTEVQAIQFHRELSNSFVVRHMGSLTDRLEMIGSPAASKIAAQLKRFAYYLASYAGHGTKSAIRNGKLWSNKLQKARHKINKAGNLEFGGGHIDLSTFKRVLYGPAMQYFHHRRDILNDAPNRDTGEDRLIESWLNHKAAESPAWKPIIDAARSELRAFYKQTAVNSRQIADVASKMGVLVYDEEGGYFRERIGSSLTTTMRQTNDVAKNVWRFISPVWGHNKRTASELAGTSEKPDAQNLSVEEFDAYVMNRFGDLRTINEFAFPIVTRPGSSVFYDIDGSVLPRKWVTDSLTENPNNMVGFLNTLALRAGVEKEDVREFQAGIVNRFQSFFDKLDSVVDEQKKGSGFLEGKRAIPIHIMMDARKFNDFPLEWVDYADFTERRMYQFVKNLSAEAAFGRDMVQVHNDFDLARNDINAAKALHDEIVSEIGKLGFFSKLGPAWLNWGKRSYYKKYDELAVDKQAKMAGPKYSGKFLRKSIITGRLIDGIDSYFRAYMAKERDSALEFTVWNELIRALTGLIVQAPGTALVDTIAIVEQPYRKMGFNKFGFEMMLKNITGSFGIGAGSFFQVFNRSIKFAADDMAKMMELGLDDATASLEGGWFKRLATEFRSNMSDEMVGQNMLTRGVEKTARGIRAFLEAGKGRPEEGKGAFPVFRPQAIFSQIAKQSAMANTLTTWKMFRNFVANAADYIEAHPEAMKLYHEKGMIFNENALGAEGLNNALDEMGYGRSFLFFSNRKAYHNMYNTLIEGGFNLEKVALDYIERRKADSKADPLAAGYAPNNALLMALAHTTTSQVMLETDVTTRSPMFLTNSFGYASMPLLGWSWQKFVDINKSMASDRNAHGAFLGTVESLKTYLAILPIGLIYAFLRDEYDEEIVGKKSSLQSGKGLFFKGDGMPSLKEIQTDPYNSLQVAVERFDRVGIFGLGGEILSGTLNAESARELSIDSRVYALNTLRTTRRVLTALALQRPWNATYATIYRPLLSGYGGSGFLQYGQILNNAMAKMGGDPLFETEYAMAQRIGTNNYLRAAGRYLDMDVRTFSGTRGITTTRMRPWVSDMLMAAVVDDEQWFDESWRRAIEEAEAMGKTDPVDTVKRSFQAYHPLRYIYQTMPTELEYLGILNTLEETSGIEGKIQVQQTIQNINDYGTLLGITPSEGKAERAPTKTSVKAKLRRELFGDSFRKPSKQDILAMVSGL